MKIIQFSFGSLYLFFLALPAQALPIGNHTTPHDVPSSSPKEEPIAPFKPEAAISITEKLKKYKRAPRVFG